MKSKANILIFLPIIVSYVSWSIVIILGHGHFSLDGTGNELNDTFAKFFVMLILLGLVVSIFFLPFLFVLRKIKEALSLLLCIVCFLLYFLLSQCVVEFFR